MYVNYLQKRLLVINIRGSNTRLRSYGFTLIELMMVIATIAVLITIAFPSYEEQLRKSRRADAQGTLLAFAIAMERFNSEQGSPTYVGATAASAGAGPGSPIATVFPTQAPLDGANKYYNLTVQAAAVTSYELRAAPTGTQAGDDCGTYTLMSTGARNITGGAVGITWQDCWR